MATLKTIIHRSASKKWIIGCVIILIFAVIFISFLAPIEGAWSFPLVNSVDATCNYQFLYFKDGNIYYFLQSNPHAEDAGYQVSGKKIGTYQKLTLNTYKLNLEKFAIYGASPIANVGWFTMTLNNPDESTTLYKGISGTFKERLFSYGPDESLESILKKKDLGPLGVAVQKSKKISK